MTQQLYLCLGLIVAALVALSEARNSPLVFIPGKGGCQIEARINRDSNDTLPNCLTLKPWHRIWLDVWHFLWPGQLHCWADNFRLHYDPETRKSSYTPGVEFRMPGFGETHTVEYVDDSWTAYIMGNFAAYFVFVCDELSKWGYTRGHNIRAAPYDFRFAPHSSAEYFEKLRVLVEDTYKINDNTPVTLLGHSLGGIYGVYFLHSHMNDNQEWKDKYINAFVPVNCPWKGTVGMSNLYTSGYNWGIAPLERSVLKMQMTSWETGVLLLPQEDAWDFNDILVSTPQRNYTARDYDDYFRDVNNPIGRQLFDNIRHKSYDMSHPGVDTYCVYSYGTETPNQLVYDEGEFPNGYPTMLMGPGDGTVNLMSLKFCKKWLVKHDTHHKSEVRTFEGVPHIDLLYNPEFFLLLKEIVTMD